MRRFLTLLLVLFGFGLMVVSYFSSAPWGSSTVADSDPAFVGAPTLFVIGILLVLASALIYELLPTRDDDRVG